MALMKLFKKISDPYPDLSHERQIPQSDIVSVQAFIQAKTFRGYRREPISTYGLDGVERNICILRDQQNFDLTGSRIDIMTVKMANKRKCLRILVDGKFIGNIYKNDMNTEYFDKAVKQKIDGAYVKIDTVMFEGRKEATKLYLMLHWPGIGPRVDVDVK